MAKGKLASIAQVLRYLHDKAAKIHSKGGKKVDVRADILIEDLRKQFSDEQLAKVLTALKGQRGKNVASLTKEGQTDYPAPSAIVEEAKRRNFMDTPPMKKKAIKKAGGYPYHKGGVYTDKAIQNFRNKHPEFKGLSSKKIQDLMTISAGDPAPFRTSKIDTKTGKPRIPKRKPPAPKRPEMMHGGVHKSKKHAYAAGGMVKDMNIMRSK